MRKFDIDLLDDYYEWLEKIVKIQPPIHVIEIKIKRKDEHELDLTKLKHPDCKFPNLFLTKTQLKKIEEWEESLNHYQESVESSGISYHFNLENEVIIKIAPTGLGDCYSAKSNNFEIDLTDFDNW